MGLGQLEPKTMIPKPSLKKKLFDPKGERFQYLKEWYKMFPRGEAVYKGKRK